MIWTACVTIAFLCLLGLLSGYTMGGVIPILLVMANIGLVAQLVQG
jgi:hypothetical protein